MFRAFTMEQRAAPVKPGHDAAAAPAIRGARRWAAVAGVIVALSAAAGIPAPASRVQTTGDEPHYLLTADALGRDGTLDVAEAHAQERYRPYHDAGLAPQGVPAADGRLLAPHDPLLPALLAVPMRLGGWVAAKAALAALAGLLAAVVTWTAAVRGAVPAPVAAVVTVLLAAAPPLATYGSQVYPELPAAFAVAVAIAAVTGPMGRPGLVMLGCAVTALPWLGVKYAPVAAVLAGLAMSRLWRGGRRGHAVTLAAALAVAGLAYAAAHQAWYGGLTVYAAGSFFQQHGGELSVIGTGPDYLGRSSRLLGLLVDGEFGLAAWQPAWLLSLPALLWSTAAWRLGRLNVPAVAAPLLAGWLTASFVAATMHGWWFPGRQVVVVLPAAILLVASWVGRDVRRLRWMVALGALGLLAHAWLVVEGFRGDVSWAVSFTETSNPVYQALRAVLPSYRHPHALTWWLHGAWLVALGAIAARAWCAGRARGRRLAQADLHGAGV